MRVRLIVCFSVDVMQLIVWPDDDGYVDPDGCAYFLVSVESRMLSRNRGRIFDFYACSAHIAFIEL